ncbi:FadR/GntR family transcriptional regulator [Caulobacter sp. 17J80-11]|uniref:FadR/GntR family transcriptional regulator n=1 Tax=Caulobacter sp. 17J80-11 TaxID=2763502 RepID=UPI002104180A|nr:FadR/GntR family transcriptional regulator [Caulobacter sp. 17J80-11]
MDGSNDIQRRAGQPRLFHAVAEQIAALIDDGVFPPGAKLPGERELAERFGVSRVTVREAAVALQASGRVDIRAGSGVYVRDRADARQDGLPEVSAFELTEARSLFESEAAALAAPIISDEDLARLDVLVAAMSGESEELSADEADRQFHLLIASASGNRAIIHTITSLWRMRTELSEVQTAHASVCEKDASSRIDEHAAVLDALKRKDPVGARAAMRRHFNRLIEAMLDAEEKRAFDELRRKATESRQRFLISARIG